MEEISFHVQYHEYLLPDGLQFLVHDTLAYIEGVGYEVDVLVLEVVHPVDRLLPVGEEYLGIQVFLILLGAGFEETIYPLHRC